MSPELTTWLQQQHRWIRVAAERLLSNSRLLETDIAEFAEIIKQPAKAEETPAEMPAPSGSAPVAAALRLVSIGPIKGINALGTRLPLAFGKKNLAVVYGNNGSGKSGYVRIICNACAKPHAGELWSDVFSATPARQECRITYAVDGAETEVDWSPGNRIDALANVDVFDATLGRIYLENETEAAFIPPELALLADLVAVCGKVESILVAEECLLAGTLPNIPVELNGTAAAKALQAINDATSDAELTAFTAWTEVQTQELGSLTQALAIAEPALAAQKRRGVKRERELLASAIKQAIAQLTDPGVEATRSKLSNTANKRRIAQEAAEALRGKSTIDGVGSETWRALWGAARAYSETEAYPTKSFPNVDPGARCVFCHQELDESASDRLAAFETYVSGKVEAEATKAERELTAHLGTIVSRPLATNLQTAIHAAELEAPLGERLEQVWAELEQCLQLMRQATIPVEAYVPRESVVEVLTSLATLARSAETEAETLER